MPSLRQWFPFQEVHTRIPMSGINGWIIGWALIMEYAIGNITVYLGDYFRTIGQWRNHLPQWVQMDYLTASTGYRDATACRVENSMKI
jgi:hypothetical protein